MIVLRVSPAESEIIFLRPIMRHARIYILSMKKMFYSYAEVRLTDSTPCFSQATVSKVNI